MKFSLRHIILSLVALTAPMLWTARADIPAGYYTSLNGKTGADLKTAVHNLVRNFTQVSSYSALPSYFMQTDVYPESRRWWDMYSDIPLYAPSFSGLNREHSFPKSWWGGLTNIPAYVDLNHLYPSEAAANMAKSNYPLGEVSTSQKPKFENGITTVGYPVAGQGGGAGFVFEPADEYKGDFARTYFYMATTYQDLTWKYTYMVSQNTYPTLNTWSVNLLLKWHHADPVSEKETLRNEAVYKIQNNRNPFIDFPELADYIWGAKTGMPFDPSSGSEPAGDPNLITPVQDMALDFGEVAVGKSVTSRLWFNGESLTAPIEL
ncbi:MAG: endonuclease, partial [Muribaculaceae bacterium]|nr:endonuclease [Muribaculaceae bacterium]